MRLETPGNWGGLVDLDPSPSSDDAMRLLDTILESAGEDQVAFRSGQRLVARLTRLAPRPAGGPLELKSNATYLVTGGLGSVGLHIGRWLAERGAKHLALLGRSLPSDDGTALPAIRALERRGVDVQVIQGDVGEWEQLQAILERLHAGPHPLRGIVHAAGVLTPMSVHELTPEAVEEMFRAKIAGAEFLHRLTSGLDLDLFVMFSSAASVIGSERLSHYAAANQYLDALAHHRRSKGLPALTVNWGRWTVVSRMMSQAGHRWLEAQGMRAFAPEEALAALELLLADGTAQATVLSVDPVMFNRIASDTRGGFFSRVTTSLAIADTRPARSEKPAVTGESSENGQPPLEEYLRSRVAHALGLGAGELDVNEPINSLGLDSIMALQLKNRIEVERGLKVPVVHFLNGDSVAQLALTLAAQPVTSTDQKTDMAAAASAAAVDALSGRDPNELSDEEVDLLLSRFLPSEAN